MKPLRITLFALLLAGCSTPIPPPRAEDEEKAREAEAEQERFVAAIPPNWLPIISSVRFLPDGKRALTFSRDAKSHYDLPDLGIEPGSGVALMLWDVNSGKLLRTLLHRFVPLVEGDDESPGLRPRSLAISPDGKLVAVGTDQPVLLLWEIDTSKPPRKIILPKDLALGQLASVAFTPDGMRILTGNGQDFVFLDPVSGNVTDEFKVPAGNSVDLSADGKKLFLSKLLGDCQVFDLATKQIVKTIKNKYGNFSPDGKYLLMGAELWDLDTERLVRKFEATEPNSFGGVFSADGKWLLSARNENDPANPGLLELWDVSTGKRVREFTYGEIREREFRFRPRPEMDRNGSGDKGGQPVVVIPKAWIKRTKAPEAVRGLAFSPDAKLALSCGAENSLRLWDVTSGKEIRRFKVTAIPKPIPRKPQPPRDPSQTD